MTSVRPRDDTLSIGVYDSPTNGGVEPHPKRSASRLSGGSKKSSHSAAPEVFESGESFEPGDDDDGKCFSTSTADTLLTLNQFLIFALCFVATPIAQLEVRVPYRACYTMWGYKHYCSNTKYDATGVAAFGCSSRASHFAAGAACSVLGSIIGAALLVLMFVKISPLFPRLPRPAFYVAFWVLSALEFIFTLVAFAVVAGAYTRDLCKDGTSFSEHHLTAGFAMLVIACGLQSVSWIFMFLGWHM